MNKLYEYKTFDDANILVESSKDGKELFMAGLFIQGNVKNQNGRVYPRSEIETAVNSIQERIQQTGGICGELDHPEELQINLDRVSHVITEMQMNGSDGFGKLKIIDTPMGNIAKALLKANAKLGVSSRGSGNVDDSGQVSEFDIVTIDIVAQPSAPDAYPKTIYESLFNMRGGQTMHNLAEAATYDNSAKNHLQKSIINLINELKKS